MPGTLGPSSCGLSGAPSLVSGRAPRKHISFLVCLFSDSLSSPAIFCAALCFCLLRCYLFTVELAIKSERRKRDVSHQAASDENILLVQSIQITDKFAFNGADGGAGGGGGGLEDGLAKLQLELGTKSDTCINGYGELGLGSGSLGDQFGQSGCLDSWLMCSTVASRSRSIYSVSPSVAN